MFIRMEKKFRIKLIAMKNKLKIIYVFTQVGTTEAAGHTY
jgi:hypothetical protein